MLSTIFLYLDSATDDGQYEIVSLVVHIVGLLGNQRLQNIQ